MNVIDNMPIFIVVMAVIANIVLGIKDKVDFSSLMIRSMIVTIVFGVFGYLLCETIKKSVEYSRIGMLSPEKRNEGETAESLKNKSTLDIKVPPLDDKEIIDMNSADDSGFMEVNPANMKDFGPGKQN